MSWRWAALIGVAVVLAALGGAYLGRGPSAPSGAAGPVGTAEPLATETATPRRPKRTPTATPTPRPWVQRSALAAEVRRIAARGPVGVALRPLGRGGVWQTGAARTGKAWSTMKVPVVLARLRLEPGDTADRARAALTASDNAAAQSLFDDIARVQDGVEGASQFVERTLRDAGDRRTVVNSAVPPGGFSTFGQTEWSLSAGTRFFSALARGCLAPSAADVQIADLMGEVIADQRWGLGAAGLRDVRFKGGWGPDPDGRYLVRQFGFVRTRDGRGLAIGLLARPSDGSFDTGVIMLTELARAVAEHTRLRSTPRAARCV